MTARRRLNRPPSIVDVANLAGVSPATVSRFYNAPELVRLPTRQRIEAAVGELGYIRNRQATALHNTLTGSVGLIVPTVDNAIFAELIEAFATRLAAHKRALLLSPHGYDLGQELLLVRTMIEHRVDAIGLIGFDHLPETLALLRHRDVPLLSMWNHAARTGLSCVGSSNRRAGRMLARHVLGLGHREIALVFPDTVGNDRARDRKSAMLAELDKHGCRPPPAWQIQCPYDTGAAKQAVARLLQSPARPGAILCGNDIIAHGAIYAGLSLGLRLPDDVSIAGIGDFRGSAEIEPGLTTVRMPARRIGAVAADRIVAAIETGEPAHVEVRPRLRVRGSTAPARL